MSTALLLGAAVLPDGPSPAMRRRTARAVQLYQAGCVGRIVCCGGQGAHGPCEAEAMRDLLRAACIPAAAIILEDRSRNTGENIAFALAYLDRPGAAIVIVTDRYHMPRARLVARRLGLAVTGAAPPRPPLTRKALMQALREGPALLWYAATFWPSRNASAPSGTRM